METAGEEAARRGWHSGALGRLRVLSSERERAGAKELRELARLGSRLSGELGHAARTMSRERERAR